MNRFPVVYAAPLGLVLCTVAARSASAAHTVTVTANADMALAPVTAALPEDLGKGPIVCTDEESGAPVVAQIEEQAGHPAVTWLVPPMTKGQTRRYRLEKGDHPPPAGQGVTLEPSEKALEIRIDGEPFTTYVTNGMFKPYWWPMHGPTGKPITRAFPMKLGIKGELPDHPHHRSFWFTHGSVNGVDFWAETPAAGKTVHREFVKTISGPVFGEMVVDVDWLDRKGNKVCSDQRSLRVYRVPDVRLFDFAITLRATEGPVVFGDTKEGMFGFRVAGTMNWKQPSSRPKGTLTNSTGALDKDVWGKRAEWCDYHGPVEGETVGIAIFDSPTNLRHPTYWHARDYGLFCANPFGVGDFTGDKKNDGGHTVPKGEELSFHYRIYMHKGTTQEANVAKNYAAFADPPTVEID